MFYSFSKFLPLFFYPLGFASLAIIAALWLGRTESRRKAQTVVLVLALGALWLGGNRVVSMGLGRLLEWQFLPLSDIPPVDAIVVLGGATEPLAYPRPTHEVGHAGDRMLYAARLYQQGIAPVVIVSGGNPPGADPHLAPEAVVMADILMLAGVPAEAIILEDQSINTYTNALKCNAILQENGYERIALVTSALHMPRSVRVFAQYDIEIVPAPTDFRVTAVDWHYYTRPNLGIQLMNFMPRVDNLERTTAAIKEMLGLLIYWLRGWI